MNNFVTAIQGVEEALEELCSEGLAERKETKSGTRYRLTTKGVKWTKKNMGVLRVMEKHPTVTNWRIC